MDMDWHGYGHGYGFDMEILVRCMEWEGLSCSHEWNNIFVYMEGFRNGMMGVELSVTADSCDTI